MTLMPEDNLAYTLAGVSRKKDPYEARRSFAQRIQAQGMDTSPIQSPWQGAARLAQALAGSYGMYAADRDEKKATEDRNTKLAEVMAEKDPQKKIGLLTAIDPEYGARLSGQMAVEQAKIDRQREGLQTAAGSFGASYGAPQITQGALSPPGGYQGTLGGYESGNNPTALNPQSGAGGQFQFIPPTWAEVRTKHPDLQLPESPTQATPQQQAAAEARFRDSNAQALQAAGIAPTPAALYLAHRTGAQGAQTLIKADPNAPMSSVVPPQWIAQNPDMQGKTVGQFLQMAQSRFPGGGQPPAAPPVNVQATPPGMPQPLQIDMRGPGGMPQGSADGRPPAPSPQGLNAPVMTAQAPPQAPAIPDVPRPRPTPQMLEQYEQRFASGEFGTDPGVARSRARAALEAEIDRDWGVQRDRAKMQFQQQTTDFADQRRTQREVEREANKPMNDTQALAATYADRMAEANAVVGTLPASVQTAGEGKIVGSIPFVGDYLANQVRSSEFQRYQQAKDNFIYSQLRKESGAVIGKDEYTAADRQYFPQPGDSKEVIAQKEVNRQIAIDGMIRSAGQTYRPAQARSSNPPAGGGQRQRISLDGKPL